METNLRPSKTKVQVAGLLSSKDLEKIVDKNGNNGIKGSLTIKVDDTNSIRFKVYVGEKTSKGEINKAWAGMNTVLNEYKSIAEVGEAEADFIYGNGNFETYKNQSGQDVTTYKCNFFSRAKTRTPLREFQVEAFVKSITPEVVGDEETGRLKITAIEPCFGGISILEIMVPQDLADAVESNMEVGCTYKIDGELVNSRVEKQATALIGKVKAETSYKSELVLTGCTPAYEDEMAYSADSIKLAIQEYETAQANRPTSGGSDPVPFNQKPSGATSGRSLSF